MTSDQGTPSDDLPGVAATGRTDVGRVVVSLSARHPEGQDADYLRWHALDHRPEQYRLHGLRGASRFVSTPACRAARAASDDRYDATDHVMIYLFAAGTDLADFFGLGAALNAGGRMPIRLPPVELGIYERTGAAASSRVLVGADVIPWRPAVGAYLLVERGTRPAEALVDVAGVAGAWWLAGTDPAPDPGADTTGLQLTCCWLDDDAVATAGRLRPALEERWGHGDVEPLLAAPLHTVVPFDWSRNLP